MRSGGPLFSHSAPIGRAVLTKHVSRDSYLLSIRNFSGKRIDSDTGVRPTQPDVDNGITSTLYGAVSFQPEE